MISSQAGIQHQMQVYSPNQPHIMPQMLPPDWVIVKTFIHASILLLLITLNNVLSDSFHLVQKYLLLE